MWVFHLNCLHEELMNAPSLVTRFFHIWHFPNLPAAVHDQGSLCPSLVSPRPTISAPALSGWTPAFPERCEHRRGLPLQGAVARQNHGTETPALPCCPPGSRAACLSRTESLLNTPTDNKITYFKNRSWRKSLVKKCNCGKFLCLT